MKYIVEGRDGIKKQYSSKTIGVEGDFFRFGNTMIPIKIVKCIYLEEN